MLIAFLLITKWAHCFGFSIEDETVKTIRGCPSLHINDNIQVLRQPTNFTKYSQAIDVYIKKLIDWDRVISLIEPHLLESLIERYKKLTSTDMQGSLILFPSAVWIPTKQLYIAAARVSLFGKCSFIYVTFYDSDWNEVITEDYIGKVKVPGFIPFEINNQENWTGPEDPRLFVALNNELFMVFNLKIDKNRMMYLYRFSTGTKRALYLQEYQAGKITDEKNWTPLIVDNEHLYFVYNFKNLQIIDCTEEPCKKIKGNYDPKPEALRGGSPFVRFEDSNYYVSLSYTHIFIKNCHYYRPVFVILEVIKEQQFFKMIYQSEPFDLNSRILLEPITDYKEPRKIRDCMMVIPSSIASWSFEDDIADLHITVEDRIPTVVRVKGLTRVVQYIINMYEYGRLPENENCAEKFSKMHFLSESPKKAY